MAEQFPSGLKSLMDAFAAYGKADESAPLPRARPQPAFVPTPSARPDYAPVAYHEAGPPAWPDQSDVELSKKYDTLYGSTYDRYATPGIVNTRTMPLEASPAFVATPTAVDPSRATSWSTSDYDADLIRQQAVAAERSALAKLGYDPGRAIRSPKENRYAQFLGTYSPSTDLLWYYEQTPAAGMHESMHRGVKMLREGGKLPRNIDNTEEEKLVRALMRKAYGDVELQQVTKIPNTKLDKSSAGWHQMEAGKRLVNDPLVAAIEEAAANEISRRRPRGPR